MDLGHLQVHIGRRGKGNFCTLVVRLFPPDDVPDDLVISLRIPPIAHEAHERVAEIVADIAPHVITHIEQARGKGSFPQDYNPGRLLLQIEPLDLVALDWEGHLTFPRLNSAIVTRFRPVSDVRVLRPLELPLGVLSVLWLDNAIPEPTDRVMRYFRNHRVSGVLDADVPGTISNIRCEVVHLAIDATWLPNGSSEVHITHSEGGGTAGIGVAPLSRALSACDARILILQCVQAASYLPALNFAHRLVGAGGPTTFVLNRATTSTLDAIFMGVVHDAPMYWIAGTSLTPPVRAALFHSIGGDNPLRIRPVADGLLREMQLSDAAGKILLSRLRREPQRPIVFGGPSSSRAADELLERTLPEFEANLAANSNASERVYDYAHESGAWIPIRRTALSMRGSGHRIEAFQRSTDRVVNVGLAQSEGKLRRSQSLSPGEHYELSVQIGRRTD